MTVALTTPTAARATETPADIFDAEAIITSIAPEIWSQTVREDSALKLEARGAGGPVLSMEATENARQEVSSRTGGELETSPELSVVPTYVTGKEKESAGITVWETTSSSTAAYVQPLSTGMRVMTAIADSSAPSRYEYQFDVPDGTHLQPNGLGFMILGPTGDTLGQLHSAWARDSAGASVPTHYKWDNGTLTQVVDLSKPSINFPVLIDPAWSYTHYKNLDFRTPGYVYNRMMNCFNCVFPVEGAPAGFPSYNQYLPLVVRPFVGAPISWDFSCWFDHYHWYDGSGDMDFFGFMFRASNTHVDGAGSTISFDFNPSWPAANPSYVRAQMVVSGYIMNDNPVGLGQPAYTLAATATWNTFAGRLDAGW